MKIVQITDIHLVAAGETIQGIDPAKRLRAVIDDVIARFADADLAVFTGDLTDTGAPEAYEILKAEIARLPMPVRLLLGNHDERAAFRAAFPDAATDGNGFIQSSLDAPGQIGRLLFLDTNETSWSGGRYCEARLDWLDDQLAGAAGKPVTVFMHHPPGDIGVTHFEAINLQEPEALVTRLKAHPGGVRMVFIGHVHLPMSGILKGGLPFTAGRGCTHHMVLDVAARDCKWIEGGPNYSVVFLDDDRLFIHAIDRLDAPLMGIGAYPPGP